VVDRSWPSPGFPWGRRKLTYAWQATLTKSASWCRLVLTLAARSPIFTDDRYPLDPAKASSGLLTPRSPTLSTCLQERASRSAAPPLGVVHIGRGGQSAEPKEVPASRGTSVLHDHPAERENIQAGRALARIQPGGVIATANLSCRTGCRPKKGIELNR
jgi:hypothetical protein